MYAFEPFPRNARYLRRHIELNQLQNCRVIEAVASDTEGTQKLSQTGQQSVYADVGPHVVDASPWRDGRGKRSESVNLVSSSPAAVNRGAHNPFFPPKWPLKNRDYVATRDEGEWQSQNPTESCLCGKHGLARTKKHYDMITPPEPKSYRPSMWPGKQIGKAPASTGRENVSWSIKGPLYRTLIVTARVTEPEANWAVST